ncbi:trichohyalin-like protein 1 [Puma concolor]|uniref:Trichohyalin-like protein 1 n=1 Tax=Puma concolor TaxID=9696 RepID=A0A6P6GYD9_PUMCO|nr:trichohyalin-like protein 1 [Puma concolor]
MSRLLRDVLCVIETFHKYAREAGDEATLTCTELKRLIQGEFGDVLQPHAILAVERNLYLLDIHSNGTISFDEFVLAIFNLLNLCYLDIQSLLKSELRQVSEPEKKPSGMDLQVTSGTDQWTEQTAATQDRVAPPSGMALSAQLSPKERGHNGVNPQGNTKTYKLLVEASEHNDSKNQHLEKDQRSQKTAQGTPATGDSGAQLESNKSRAESEQIGGPTKGKGQDKDSPREGDKPVREQSSTKTRDQFGEQEGNLRTQSDLPEKTQRPAKDQEVAAEKGIKEHSKTQELSLPGKDDPSSEHTDLPEQEADQKSLQTEKPVEPEDDDRTSENQEPGEDAGRTPPETKNTVEPRDDGRTSETQEPPAQEKEHEPKNLPDQGDSINVSETPDVRAVRKERRGSKAHGTAGEKENERKIQLPTLEDQPQDGKYQELQVSSKGRLEGSKIKGLSSQRGNQNHPEIEGRVTPEEARHAEKCIAEALKGIKNATVAEGTPGARERTQELEPLKNQSGEENKRVTKTHDKPVKEDDGYQGKDPEPTLTQNNDSSPETPNSLAPEDGDSSSETTDLPVKEDAQSQIDPLREPVERSHNNNPDPEKQVALGEERTQEVMVPAVGEDKRLPEEPEWAAREDHRSQGSGTKGPGPAVHPDGHPEAQESTASGENRKALETEIPGTLDVGFTDQLSIRQLPAKEDSSKMLKAQSPSTKGKEGGAPETQEARVKSLDEDNSASPKTQLEREEPTTLKEDEIPQELAEEANDQQIPAKKGYDASVPQSGLEEKTQMDKEPRFVERGAVYASPLYQYLQEKILQQMDMTQAEQQNQARSAIASNPDHPISFDDSQALHSTREHLPGTDPAHAQQTLAPQASEDKQDHLQGENPVLQREASTKKQ